MKTKLITQISYYFSNGILILIASMISFPIWSRTFTVEDYGLMALGTATISFIITFAKFGIQHAILRFYADFDKEDDKTNIKRLYSTAIIGSTVLGFLIGIVYLIGLTLFKSSLNPALYIIFQLISAAAITDNLFSICVMFLRAKQNAAKRSLYVLLNRYGRLIVCILLVIVLKQGLTGFFVGHVAVQAIVSLALIIRYIRKGYVKTNYYSNQLLKEMVSYGVPLIGFELTNNLMRLVNRYIIQIFLGQSAVAMYVVPLTISTMLSELYSGPLRLAGMPKYMQAWAESGKEKTEQFINQLLKYYFIISIPILSLASIFARDIISLIASEKYADSASVTPIVLASTLFAQGAFLFGAGLYLKKASKILFRVNFVSALLNVGLCLWLIPIYGILGAALATLVTYIIQAAYLIYHSHTIVKIEIPYIYLVKVTFLMIVIGYIALNLNVINHSYAFILKGVLALFVYMIGVVFIDPEFRKVVGQYIKKMNRYPLRP